MTRTMPTARPAVFVLCLVLCSTSGWLIPYVSGAEPAKSASAPLEVPRDIVLDALQAHARAHPSGEAAFSWDQKRYQGASNTTLSELPIGVFDSGIGGLTVLEALLRADFFNNDTLQPCPDGRPDFAGEKFVYLGDQANMPYGNYPSVKHEDYLRELILKDVAFLLGKRYHLRGPAGRMEVRFDKAPVKAVVIACNTATAFGLEAVREMLRRMEVPVLVVGVVDAAARGLKETPGDGAVGVLATLGTCASNVYPKTVARTFGMAGRPQPLITQWGSAQLAAVIEGDPAFPTLLEVQTAADVKALVKAHIQLNGSAPGARIPLQKIILGCTHFPLVIPELDAAFESLRARPEFADWIALHREFVNPAEWTARELFRELSKARLRRPATNRGADLRVALPAAAFFISTANDECPGVRLSAPGVLDSGYKYDRMAGALEIEDTLVIPMTRHQLPDASRALVREKLPAVWNAIP